MKLFVAFLVTTFVALSFNSEAQDDSIIECPRLNKLAEEAISKDDFNTATTYLLHVRNLCGELEFDNSFEERLIGCLKTLIYTSESVDPKRRQYTDTILRIWNDQELEGRYNTKDDLERASLIMSSESPNPEKADSLFQRGIKTSGTQMHQSHIIFAYYTTYTLFLHSSGKKREIYEQRMLHDYLHYLELSEKDTSKLEMPAKASIDTYFEGVYPNCESMLPNVNDYIDSLPKDTLLAIGQIKLIENLLDGRNCIQNNVYRKLIDTWIELDTNSFYARLRKIQTTTNGTIAMMDSLLKYTRDSVLIERIQYQKTYAEYKAGQYRKAHSSGLKCSGEYKSKGLLIAAQSVAATATVCGDSTFERKCNYLYAAQLAEEAGMMEKAEMYRKKAPSTNCTTDLIPVNLSCWGVTVDVCP